MKIIVFVKQSGYVYHPIAIESAGGGIDPEKMVYMLNPNDEVALEEAIRLKENIPGSEVIVITAGPPRTEEALRYAFALGADRMIRINCEHPSLWFNALVLAEVIKDMAYDIILCGKKTIDGNNGQMGSFIAEALNVAQVSGIVSLNILPDEKKAIVDRYLGKGDREEVECDLPALFTVEMSMNDPRYPTLANRLLSETQEIEQIEVGSLGINQDERFDLSDVMTLGPARPKPKKVFTPDSNLSPSERMRLIMSGGVAEKKSDLFKGAPEDIADKIVEILIQEKII